MNEIGVEELAQWRASGRDFVLLDVREPFEIAAASLPGSTNIRMREIPPRAGELPRDKDIAVLCHHGNRSAVVTEFLSAQGFRAYNVAGGIDAYAKRVDASVGAY